MGIHVDSTNATSSSSSSSLLGSALFALRLLFLEDCIDEALAFDLSSLMKLCACPDEQVRYQCAALTGALLGFSPALVREAQAVLVSSAGRAAGCVDETSGRACRIPRQRQAAMLSFCSASTKLVSRSPLRTRTVRVCGLSLATLGSSQLPKALKLVECPSTKTNILKLVEAIAMDCPIILQGKVGSGKSFLLRELASVLDHDSKIVELHLDDQIDSKTLLGGYVCSDVPGEFLWRPGILTSAVSQGSWLVLENIDRVPLDIISSLVSLMERRCIPSHSVGHSREIRAHPSFRLFGTHTLTSGSSEGELLCMRHFLSYFLVVRFSVLTVDELVLILRKQFPRMIGPARQMVLATFGLFSGKSRRLSHNRKCTIRDLTKAAGRLSARIDFNVESSHMSESQRVVACLECVDVFCASIREAEVHPNLSQFNPELSQLNPKL